MKKKNEKKKKHLRSNLSVCSYRGKGRLHAHHFGHRKHRKALHSLRHILFVLFNNSAQTSGHALPRERSQWMAYAANLRPSDCERIRDFLGGSLVWYFSHLPRRTSDIRDDLTYQYDDDDDDGVHELITYAGGHAFSRSFRTANFYGLICDRLV